MNSFAAVAVKTVGAAGVAALLSVGAIGALAAMALPAVIASRIRAPVARRTPPRVPRPI